MLKIAVMGSGKGSNFNSIMQEIRKGKIPGAQIVVVISNNSDAGILGLARSYGVPAERISRKSFASGEQFSGALIDVLKGHEANFIVLAGYMKRIPSRIIAEYKNRIINIHPALLPRHGGQGMYGMHVHESVIASGDRVSGATVHLVDEEYDRGPVILQRTVPIDPGETAQSLAAKVLVLEHELLPEAIRMFAEGYAQTTNTAVH